MSDDPSVEASQKTGPFFSLIGGCKGLVKVLFLPAGATVRVGASGESFGPAPPPDRPKTFGGVIAPWQTFRSFRGEKKSNVPRKPFLHFAYLRAYTKHANDIHALEKVNNQTTLT